MDSKYHHNKAATHLKVYPVLLFVGCFLSFIESKLDIIFLLSGLAFSATFCYHIFKRDTLAIEEQFNFDED